MAKDMKMKNNKMNTGRPADTRSALKAALAILGVGLVAGTTLVIGLDKIMKTIFVDEDWPEEEWSNNEWADEDLDS